MAMKKENAAMSTESTQHDGRVTMPLASDVFARAIQQMHRFVCGLHGHDVLLHFEVGRMSLQCTACGYETPGWDLQKASQCSNAIDPSRIVRAPYLRQRQAT